MIVFAKCGNHLETCHWFSSSRMAESHCYRFFLKTLLLTGFTLGLEACAISACSGDSVQLYERIPMSGSNTIVSLYRTRDNTYMIASWNVNSKSVQGNLILDENNNIWILNVRPSDEGNYTLHNTVLDAKEQESKKLQVHLTVMIAPATTCKPKIKRADNVLKATVEDGDCGKPIVSVHWLKHLGVNYEGNDLAMLQPGREAGIYYACIHGPAVRCAKTQKPSFDQCAAFSIEASSTESDKGCSVDTLNWMMYINFILHAIQIIGPIVVAVVLYIKWPHILNSLRPGDNKARKDRDVSPLLSKESANVGNMS